MIEDERVHRGRFLDIIVIPCLQFHVPSGKVRVSAPDDKEEEEEDVFSPPDNFCVINRRASRNVNALSVHAGPRSIRI